MTNEIDLFLSRIDAAGTLVENNVQLTARPRAQWWPNLVAGRCSLALVYADEVSLSEFDTTLLLAP